jgi:L-aspartate oxidase
MENRQTNCAIIGGGFAGCTAALELAEAGNKVDLFVKGKLIEDCASNLTAGGLAAVAPFNKEDSFEKHIRDTLEAGKGLNDIKVVEYCIRHFYHDVIEWLVKKGIQFDKTNGKYDLHEEGGHSARRVFHARDKTGIAVMNVLGELVRKNPFITIHEYHMAIDLITKNKFLKTKGKDRVIGVYVYDINKKNVKAISCEGIFIATGGLGKVFLYTSNPDTATGDGFAMCYRAGLQLANMEFIQFHPTVFYDPAAENESERRFLFTEALRGEGAILKLHKNDKEDFVLRYHKQGSKATRDVTTRAEDLEMRKNGLKHVWLDCTKIGKEKLCNHFKNAYEFCLKKGIDLAKEPVPVVYAVHYSNGGVLVGKNGETELEGCYVLGETSYTGLHGATRLASNSAPECILFGRLTAKHFLSTQKEITKVPLWDPGRATEIKDKETINYYWDVIRRTMTSLCGVSRNESRLKAAKDVISAVRKNINEFYWTYIVNKDFLEARNIADAAEAILESALERKESRACHFREDFPNLDEKYLSLTIIGRKKE